MKTSQCEQLDDYLVSELPADQTAAFEQHLNKCDSCRAEVADWHSMRGVLREASLKIETPSEGLVQRVGSTLRTRTVRPQRAAANRRIAAATVACLAVAAFFTVIDWSAPQPVDTTNKEIPWVTTLEPPANVQLPDDVIGVPIDIGDPNVTVVWIYPAVSAESVTN